MNQLRNWYDIAVAKRDRTTVDVSGVDVDNLADFINSFLSDKQPQNPNPDYPLAHTLNLATEDLQSLLHRGGHGPTRLYGNIRPACGLVLWADRCREAALRYKGQRNSE
jgi:hypothetical protein